MIREKDNPARARPLVRARRRSMTLGAALDGRRCGTTSRARGRARDAVRARTVRRAMPEDALARAVPSWAREQAEDARVRRGTYCDYVIDAWDVVEVVGYRGGVVACAVGACACAAAEASGAREAANVAWFLSGGGLGASLWLIHMYVTEIKNVMRALWAVGFGASAVMAATEGSAPAYVTEHASAMWAVGPMFAALTGLAFKEGMCYGKPEAAALFLGVPAACLMHLFGAPEEWQTWTTGGVLALLSVFAARKLTQDIADDVGDKSIFMFNALEDPAEKARWIANARRSGRAYVDESSE